LPATFEVLALFTLAGSWLGSPHPHSGLMRPGLIPAVSAGTNAVHDPELQSYALRCEIVLFSCSSLKHCIPVFHSSDTTAAFPIILVIHGRR